MTLPATPFRKDHTGNGVATSFLYDWKILDETHLKVVQQVIATGIETVLVLGVDYSVTGVGNDGGGNVVITPAMPNTKKITILPSVPYEQDTDFTNQNSVLPEEAESMADKLGRQIKQIAEKLSRAVTLPETSTDAPDDYIGQMNAIYQNTVIAKDAAEDARDSILNDAGFIIVSADLLGSDTIGTVAANITAVNTVSTNIVAVDNVSDNMAAVLAVNTDMTAVTTVAGSIANVNAVAGNAANINAVAGNSANINTVAGAITNVNNVGSNIANVNTAATNMAAIIAAPTAATNAQNAQTAAEAARDIAVAAAAGMKWKNSVRAATTANRTLSGLTNTSLDGVTPIAGDRILVKNQTTARQNGIYIAASGSWTRATDLDSWTEVPSATVAVEEGTTAQDTIWICTSNSGGTIGTTSMTWVQYAGASATITVDKFAGNGTAGPFTLTGSPGSDNNAEVFVSGVRQTPGDDYTVTGNSLSFTASAYPPAPASGVTNNIIVAYGQTQAINVPASASVQYTTLAASIIASVAEMLAGTASKILNAANFLTFIDTYQPKKVLSFVPAGGSTDIVINYTFRAGFNYRIEIDNVQVGTNNTVLQAYLSNDNGATYLNSAGAYSARRIYGTSGVSGDASTSTVINTTGYGMIANRGVTGTLMLYNPAGASKYAVGKFDYHMVETGGNYANGLTHFSTNAAFACNKIKLSSSKNFSNVGRITVYEEPAT